MAHRAWAALDLWDQKPAKPEAYVFCGAEENRYDDEGWLARTSDPRSHRTVWPTLSLLLTQALI
jgi:hypothetical protein